MASPTGEQQPLNPQMVYRPPGSPAGNPSPTNEDDRGKLLARFSLSSAIIATLRLCIVTLSITVVSFLLDNGRPDGVIAFVILTFALILWSLGSVFLSFMALPLARRKFAIQCGALRCSWGGDRDSDALDLAGYLTSTPIASSRTVPLDIVFGIIMIIGGATTNSEGLWGQWRRGYRDPWVAVRVLLFIVGSFQFLVAVLACVPFLKKIKIHMYKEQKPDAYQYQIQLPAPPRSTKAVSVVA